MHRYGIWKNGPGEYLQGRNRDADLENRHVDEAGQRGGMNWEVETGMYTPQCVKWTAGACCTHRELSSVMT